MARARVKITPLGRRTQNNRQRSVALKKSTGQEHIGRDQDAENCPPNLDYNVIEEIANGVEKMILSWSHLDEGEREQNKKSILEDKKLASEASSDYTLSQKKKNSEGLCEEYSCDFPLSKHTQEHPEEGAVTAEISADGSCFGGGMGRAISKIVPEAVKHSDTMMTGDTLTEETLTKTATYWYLEASNVPPNKCMSVCTDEKSGIKSTTAGYTDVEESSVQSLHQSRTSCELKKILRKDISNSGQSSNTHSSPRTPPISERSAKRVQSQEDSSNKKLQLSMSKKTRWSEKDTTGPISGACFPDDEDCTKSPKSDCSLLDLMSNSSWNDPLVGSPCRKPSKPSTVLMEGAQAEEFGPWDNVAGRPPVIVSRVTARADSDLENCAKEKTSFLSFKLWKANKQSQPSQEGSGEIGSNGEKPHPSDTIVSELHQHSPDDHEGHQGCGVTGQTIVAPPTSDMRTGATQLSNGDRSTREMEELQIALLECATEYEIKTIEMKMKLKNIKNLKGEPLLLDPHSALSDVSDATVAGANKTTAMTSTDQLPEDEMQQLEKVKRQIYKLQQQKACLLKELTDLKKKERQFELQKKSLDAALHKLDRLEWEMVKKEQGLEDWQLQQRHVEAQLQDSLMELQRLTNLGDLAGLPMDTASLLSLLPTLRAFVQNLALKDNGGGYYSDDHSQQDEALCDSVQVDEIVSNLMHEIQGLQYELNGMVPEEPKLQRVILRQTNVTNRDQSGHNKLTRPSPRLPRDRYPYGKL